MTREERDAVQALCEAAEHSEFLATPGYGCECMHAPCPHDSLRKAIATVRRLLSAPEAQRGSPIAIYEVDPVLDPHRWPDSTEHVVVAEDESPDGLVELFRCPTREDAEKIAADLRAYGEGLVRP